MVLYFSTFCCASGLWVVSFAGLQSTRQMFQYLSWWRIARRASYTTLPYFLGIWLCDCTKMWIGNGVIDKKSANIYIAFQKIEKHAKMVQGWYKIVLGHCVVERSHWGVDSLVGILVSQSKCYDHILRWEWSISLSKSSYWRRGEPWIVQEGGYLRWKLKLRYK